jgi:hypothetical protein
MFRPILADFWGTVCESWKVQKPSVLPKFHSDFSPEDSQDWLKHVGTTLILLNFRRVVNVVLFLLGDSPASEFCADVLQHSVISS